MICWCFLDVKGGKRKMTVRITIGRRVPRNIRHRIVSTLRGLLTFQENIWQIIVSGLQKQKKNANRDGRMKWTIETEDENEDMFYKLQWLKLVIQGTPAMEEEEYNEAMEMYAKKLDKKFKKDYDVDDKLAAHFKTKIVSHIKIEEAYEKGFGALGKTNISNKLNEMGILTHIEWDKDFDAREEIYYD